MSTPADNSQNVTSRAGLYRAMAAAQMSDQEFQLNTATTSQKLAGANKIAADDAEKTADSLVSAVEGMESKMKTALVTGAVLSIVGGTLATTAMFYMGPMSEGAFGAMATGGSLAQYGAKAGTDLVSGISQAKQEQIKGEMTIAETAPKILAAYAQGILQQQKQTSQQQASLANNINNFIQGQTGASKTIQG